MLWPGPVDQAGATAQRVDASGVPGRRHEIRSSGSADCRHGPLLSPFAGLEENTRPAAPRARVRPQGVRGTALLPVF